MEAVGAARPPVANERPTRRGRWLGAACAGAALLLYAGLLAVLAWSDAGDGIDRTTALGWLAAGSAVAGAIYLGGLFHARRGAVTIAPIWIALVAVTARLIVGTSPALLESDFQRYFWDGGVVAAGVNPYLYSPEDVAAGRISGAEGDRLQQVAAAAGPTLAKVNHPHLTTVYPPAAQVAFAVSHFIDPFGVMGWRVVLCLADAVTMLLIARLLSELSLPASQIAWFAWNPLLLREVYSSLHMDILALPLLAGAVLAGLRSRHAAAALLCVIGSAVKVWPILLAPLMLRPVLGRWRALAAASAACGALLVILWLPVLVVEHGATSGFLAYGRGWQNNDGFFRAGIWATERVLNLIGVEPWHSHTVMRIVSTTLLGVVILSQVAPRLKRPPDLPRRCLIVVAAVFMLSPTQFPWYWLWCLPLLTVMPNVPLLLYTALLPLYYVQDRWFGVLWVEHAPVWGLLGLQGVRAIHRWRRRPSLSRGGSPCATV